MLNFGAENVVWGRFGFVYGRFRSFMSFQVIFGPFPFHFYKTISLYNHLIENIRDMPWPLEKRMAKYEQAKAFIEKYEGRRSLSNPNFQSNTGKNHRVELNLWQKR